MTMIAGIVGLRDDFPISNEVCDDLRQAISRHSGEQVLELRGDRHYLIKFDIGAFGSSGLHQDDAGAISLLAGEPLLDRTGKARKRPRADDLSELHHCWRRNDRSALKAARGAFCMAQFDPASRRLDLVADKLGLRSLYYYRADDYVVFASALRVLEASRVVKKHMDVRGVAEIAAMRTALADRTPYAGVKVLKAGQIISFPENGHAEEPYWRWDTIRPASADLQDLRREAYRLFSESVKLRLGEHQTAVAFLSGGLDSRCIVTALKSAVDDVHTYSVAFPDTLDQPLAERYAEAIGSIHRHVPISDDGAHSPLTNVLPVLNPVEFGASESPKRPRIIWSGEGGSGVIGYVSQTTQLVELLRNGRIEEAATRYLARKNQMLPRRLFARSIADLVCDLPRRGMVERLSSFECADPGRAISFFDLIDYQSRHLDDHYEDIDVTRVEFETPFYDSDFVALMYSVGIDACLYHDFYHKWLAEFPPVTTTVPWQTYPGHRPCPLPLPENFRDQWSNSHGRDWKRLRARLQLDELNRELRESKFPSPILNRFSVNLARWTARAGVGNYGHILTKAAIFTKYWKACGGQYVLSDPIRTTVTH
ncbi:asparagine synthase-related protein [Rhodospirillaceae bacterium SYSU D60014]|uniref:asparagine synthase-related protein n=1 Tax=Virgifigura deserti TaxID=2268457 RepID=UPI000E66EFE0